MDYMLIVVCWLPNLFPDRSWSFFSELQIYILNKLLKTSTYMSDSYFKSGVFQTELPMFFSPKTYCSFNLSILINNYFILLVAEVKNLCFFSFSYNLYPIYQEILLAVPSHITTIQSIYIVFSFISCMYLLKCHFLSGSQDRYLGLSHPPATICIPFPVLCFFFSPHV